MCAWQQLRQLTVQFVVVCTESSFTELWRSRWSALCGSVEQQQVFSYFWVNSPLQTGRFRTGSALVWSNLNRSFNLKLWTKTDSKWNYLQSWTWDVSATYLCTLWINHTVEQKHPRCEYHVTSSLVGVWEEEMRGAAAGGGSGEEEGLIVRGVISNCRHRAAGLINWLAR